MPETSGSGHGGYRPGSGLKPKWNSGSTTVIRVPEALTEPILAYARLIDGQFPSGLQVADALSCHLPERSHESVTQSSKIEALELEVATLKTERDALDQECQELAAKVGDLHLLLDEMRSQPPHESVTQSSDSSGREKVIAILKEGLPMKAGNGGAIKEKIRQALALLDCS